MASSIAVRAKLETKIERIIARGLGDPVCFAELGPLGVGRISQWRCYHERQLGVRPAWQ